MARFHDLSHPLHVQVRERDAGFARRDARGLSSLGMLFVPRQVEQGFFPVLRQPQQRTPSTVPKPWHTVQIPSLLPVP